MAMLEITVYRGEVKPIEIELADEKNKPVDLSGAILHLFITRHEDEAPIITKHHEDFSLALATRGIVSCVLGRNDTDELPGKLIGQIRAVISGKSIFSDEFCLNLTASVVPGPFIGDGSGTIPAIA
jgi:hypothetical protein